MNSGGHGILNAELELPCGVEISNRIVKSAMSENLGDKNNQPTETLINLYREWAKSGAGLLVTGNVMVDGRSLGEPRNVVVEDKRSFEKLQSWANTVKGTDAQIWVQINHPGRQALEQINKVLKAPSAVPLVAPGRKKASKKIPIPLTEDEILDLIKSYGETAFIAKEAGFHGVQIHGAHGYLVSQFLSPYTNVREDQWGGTIENRARFVLEIYREMRRRLGANYPIGIKLNSADFQKGGFSEEDSMKVVQFLSVEGIDLIEISGGNYEAPAMMGDQKESTKKREAYFMDYIEKARKITDKPLMLTGGFRSVSGMEGAVQSDAVDLIGIARPFCVYPYMAKDILTRSKERFDIKTRKSGVKIIDNFNTLLWYEAQLKRIGEGKGPNLRLNPWKVVFDYVGLIIKHNLFKK